MDGLGVECTREEFYLYEGMTGAATIDLLFRRAFGHGCDPERSKELYAIKSRYFKEGGPRLPMPGADRMLGALRSAGLTRVLVTGSAQASLLESLDRDYPGMFPSDCRVTALDVTQGKPHPEPIPERRGQSRCGRLRLHSGGERAARSAGGQGGGSIHHCRHHRADSPRGIRARGSRHDIPVDERICRVS